MLNDQISLPSVSTILLPIVAPDEVFLKTEFPSYMYRIVVNLLFHETNQSVGQLKCIFTNPAGSFTSSGLVGQHNISLKGIRSTRLRANQPTPTRLRLLMNSRPQANLNTSIGEFVVPHSCVKCVIPRSFLATRAVKYMNSTLNAIQLIPRSFIQCRANSNEKVFWTLFTK